MVELVPMYQWPRFDFRFIATSIVLASLISVHLFHFCDHVKKGLITIEHVPSKYQLADIFTKPLPRDQYMRLRDQIMG